MAQVVLTNELSHSYPRRLEVERLVRAAFEVIRGGPWHVTLTADREVGQVVVAVTSESGAVGFTSIRYDARLDAIHERLKFFEQPRFADAEVEKAEKALREALGDARAEPRPGEIGALDDDTKSRKTG